jgi:lipopolysaccharide transport system ATP-binding protein
MDEVAKSGRTVLFVSHQLAAVVSLCSRGVWLDAGRVAADGPAAEIAGRYLDAQADAAGGAAERTLRADPTRDAQILLARVLDAHGRPALRHSIEEPLAVELEFEARRDFDSLIACCRLRSRWGEILLVSHETDAALYRGEIESPERPRRAGRYRARLHLPAPLFNAGEYDLALLLFEPHKQVLDEIPPFRLELRDEGTFASRLLHHGRRGLVAVPLEWEVGCAS